VIPGERNDACEDRTESVEAWRGCEERYDKAAEIARAGPSVFGARDRERREERESDAMAVCLKKLLASVRRDE
jgi:hypothetical protein